MARRSDSIADEAAIIEDCSTSMKPTVVTSSATPPSFAMMSACPTAIVHIRRNLNRGLAAPP
ncbi:hypothetical protein DK412_13970 [Methylobacterium sp. 17Sr1-1]|nr:hypothetical protein DK412_13970 [Methylobacterium sp. 17Sr1-1]